MTMEINQRMRERFESQISPEPMSGCWLWSGPKRNQYGHGAFKLGARSTPVKYAHRVAYEMYVAPIPQGLIVRHDCDNPACVNPKHLSLGTHLDNSNDAILRGRKVRGEAHYQAIATERMVREMRMLPRREAIALGVSAGISRQAAADIASRRTWKHVA